MKTTILENKTTPVKPRIEIKENIAEVKPERKKDFCINGAVNIIFAAIETAMKLI